MTAVITLTTDFGLADWYVAAMKGAILSINPGATVVDVSHRVPPQDILHGAYVLGAAWRYFPRGTAHVAVVDPGVGTARRAIAASSGGHFFVGPDNGVLSMALGLAGDADPDQPAAHATTLAPLPPGALAVELTEPRYHLPEVSVTFHGRDIFAPVAAYLSMGVRLAALGRPLQQIMGLALAGVRREAGGGVRGAVVHVDDFGNLITNLRQEHLPSGEVAVEVGGLAVRGLSSTYAEGPGVAALIGSNGYLEISVRNGSAARVLGVGRGQPVIARPAQNDQASSGASGALLT